MLQFTVSWILVNKIYKNCNIFHYNQICRKNKYQILIDTIVIFYKQNMKKSPYNFFREVIRGFTVRT